MTAEGGGIPAEGESVMTSQQTLTIPKTWIWKDERIEAPLFKLHGLP